MKYYKEAITMKVVAMIPIKLNNERVPGKNIKKFSDGTPLMSLIQRACMGAEKVGLCLLQ